MPNWCKGTLKIRGKRENLRKFLIEGFTGVDAFGMVKEIQVIEKDYQLEMMHDGFAFHVNGTKRNFIETKYLDWWFEDTADQEEILILENYKAAWGIDIEPLVEISKKYQIDLKIYAFEQGMQFNQDIEIIKGQVIKDEQIEFDNYQWECIAPTIGG